MKLDRTNGRQKYAILKLRNLDTLNVPVRDLVDRAMMILQRQGILSFGETPEDEFFVVMLKDINAARALHAYANAADDHDREYSDEVRALALRAGPNHPDCKLPD